MQPTSNQYYQILDVGYWTFAGGERGQVIRAMEVPS